MKIKKYLSAKEGRDRIRLSNKESQLIFAFVVKREGNDIKKTLGRGAT